MKIFISAGEVSGDMHAAYLVNELKRLQPEAFFFGLGGEKLIAEGVDVNFDITRHGSIGIFEALPNLLPVFSVFQKVKKFLLKNKPDLAILVDSQGFNLPLAKFCKKAGIKTIYYIPPQEWLWGTPEGTKKVGETADLIVAIFEKEYEEYKKAGANVVYFGHPLLDIVNPSLSREEALKLFSGNEALFDANNPCPPSTTTETVIALCPGSRDHEVKNLFPILLDAAEIIEKQLPDVQFLIPVATKAIKAKIEAIILGYPEVFHNYKIIENHSYNVLNSSDLAICTSGTINMEASILGIPNIMVYKLSLLTYLIGKYILKIDKKMKYFSMPNILLGKRVIPELVMDQADPKIIAEEALDILKNKKRREDMITDMRQLSSKLGTPPIISKIAKAIMA